MAFVFSCIQYNTIAHLCKNHFRQYYQQLTDSDIEKRTDLIRKKRLHELPPIVILRIFEIYYNIFVCNIIENIAT